VNVTTETPQPLLRGAAVLDESSWKTFKGIDVESSVLYEARLASVLVERVSCLFLDSTRRAFQILAAYHHFVVRLGFNDLLSQGPLLNLTAQDSTELFALFLVAGY
jgi:hypothetical protein